MSDTVKTDQGLELWGGVEPTVSRVGDVWQDQLALTGHDGRLDDLDRFHALGLRTLRYPLLWERMERSRGRWDFAWADERMAHLRALGIEPIVGLIHHGSGPAWTSLVSDDFAEGLQAHAARVAERYPWVQSWTPVNEPLTTARFAALYGLWHPHDRDEGRCWLALLNQIDATRLSMRAIRRVNPDARLIQTDDFGRTYGTAPCRSQAAFENSRRLLPWDLLTGRVRPGHPLYRRIARYGLAERLDAIAADPCPPDLIGMNHYVTSDRFLDHRLERYPAELHGGNGEVAYADVEAVRALDPTPISWTRRLGQLWRRYGLPLAVTECHIGCTREEQLRWLMECWRAARAARAGGVDVRAVTVWSLLGAHGWNRLLAGEGQVYETGVYDVSSSTPRPTALARLVHDLATAGDSDLPLARGRGWWRRPDRLLHAVEDHARAIRLPRPALAGLIAPGGHPLNATIAEHCRIRGLQLVAEPRSWKSDAWLAFEPPEADNDIGDAIDRLIDRSLA